MDTNKKLTKTKIRIINNAIEKTKSAEEENLFPIVKAYLYKKYPKRLLRERYLVKMDMNTDEDIMNTIKSYIALHEDELYEKGLLKEYKGRIIEEEIRIRHKANNK